MTEKQIERVKVKIDKYKKALALDKKFWGGYYHDGQGLRYAAPELYIQIADYKGGLRYLNWFDKNFPDDGCSTIFLFEWAFLLFRNNKLAEAEKKLHITYFSNKYLLDKFLGKDFLNLREQETSSWEFQSVRDHFHYDRNHQEFVDFANWVEIKLQSSAFLGKVNRCKEIEESLKSEPVEEKQSELSNELFKLKHY